MLPHSQYLPKRNTDIFPQKTDTEIFIPAFLILVKHWKHPKGLKREWELFLFLLKDKTSGAEICVNFVRIILRKRSQIPKNANSMILII